MLKKLMATFTVVFFLSTMVVMAPDGSVELQLVPEAQAQTVGDAPDETVALLLSLLIPGFVQLVWTNEFTAGLTFLLLAIISSILISVLFSVIGVGFGLGSLLSLVVWLAIGYFAFLKAKPKLRSGGANAGDGEMNFRFPSLKEATLPVA